MTNYSQEHQGCKRKYYALTEEGEIHLNHLQSHRKSYKDTLDGIIEGSLRHDKD